MGISTNAILFYGIELYDADSDSEIPQKVIDLLGDDYDEDEDLDLCFLDTLVPGLDIDYHGSCDYPIWFISAIRFEASRGCAETDLDFKVEPDWEEKLKLFCEKTGFKYKEAKWTLASYWG